MNFTDSITSFEDRLVQARLLAVMVIHNPAQACPLLATLVKEGVTAVEVAWRTPNFLPMLQEIRREFPQLLLGVGTLLTPEQVNTARDVGADFGLSPGMSQTVARAAAQVGWPYVPGVMTPSDIQLALECGFRVLKYFPAETSGGLAHLQSMTAPFLHLRPRYVVLGGINEQNVAAYCKDPNIVAIGGSWLAPTADIASEDWSAIAVRTRKAMRLISTC